MLQNCKFINLTLNLKFKKLSYPLISANYSSRMFKKFINGIIDFILPGVCLHCDSPIEGSPDIGTPNPDAVRFICAKCYGRLERYNETHPWKEEMIENGLIDNSLSAFWFRTGNEIQTLMHEMKYSKMKSVGRLFGREIGRVVKNSGSEKWDYVIPVPLHRSRFRDRTYNQSEYIAQGVSEMIKVESIAKAISRTRFTGTQTKLNKAERKENIKDAFSINPKYKDKLHSKNIILVDDVITTGATIIECARTLKSAGSGKVWVCSAAYAEMKNS